MKRLYAFGGALLCACAWLAFLPTRAVAQDQPFIPANSAWASGIARQPDGKVVVVGRAGSAVALARYTASGQLDPAFGVGGRVLTPFQQESYGAALALLPDGRIAVAGTVNAAMAVLRYTPDGQLDRTFGAGGVASASLGANSVGRALVQQPDGKLVAAGYAGNQAALVRYTPDGQLDSSFGTGGKVLATIGSNTSTSALVLQPDGKLVATGSSDGNIFLLRYKTDGNLDTSFGTGGKTITDLGYSEWATSLALQGDGKLVVAGDILSGVGLVRYTSSGQLDTNFGHGGYTDQDVFQTVYDVALALAIRPDGRIIVAGEAAAFCFCDIPPSGIALAQFLGNGKLDPFFGTAGRVLDDRTGSDDYVAAVALQSDGKLLVAGGTGGYPGDGGASAFVVGRYTASGAVDSVFGMHITQFPLPARAYLPQIGRQ